MIFRRFFCGKLVNVKFKYRFKWSVRTRPHSEFEAQKIRNVSNSDTMPWTCIYRNAIGIIHPKELTGEVQELIIGKSVTALQVIPLVARCAPHIKNDFFSCSILNPINFNQQNHSKMLLECSEHLFIVRNSNIPNKNHSVC